MTAPLKYPVAAVRVARVDSLKVLTARAEARAQLWFDGELSLHDAVDELWAAAVHDGLVAKLGAEVQRILADSFAPLRDDLPRDDDTESPWDDPGWGDAAREYHAARGKRVSAVTYAPDELGRLRRLMADDVSLEQASHELNKSPGVPIATLKAAEFLVREGDPARLRAWLERHSTQEREQILRHFQHKKSSRRG